mgnify:CR=1 FL=1
MNNGVLFIAREFVAGGAAYLALRHLRYLVSLSPIDFLVTGPVCPTMVAALPPAVTLQQLDLGSALQHDVLCRSEQMECGLKQNGF